MPVNFTDLGKVSSRKTTPEGFLTVVADFARPGIQNYYAMEIPKDQLPREFQDDPYRQIRILRPESEVFDPASMQSFARKSVTDNHPPKFIDLENWKDHQIGMTDSGIKEQNKKLRVGLTIQDSEAIKAVHEGKDQLSAGYDAELIWDSGVDPVHGAYDAKQTQIRGNHIAIVDMARGGPAIRINDSWPDATPPKTGDTEPMADTLQSRTIGGISVDFSDQGAQVIDAMVKDLDQVRGQVKELKTQLADAEKQRDELQGQLDAEKKNQITDEQIETRVTERMDLVDQARKLHPELDPKGKSLTKIKAETIQHVDQSFVLDGKSEAYVDGIFDTLYARREDTSTATMRTATSGAGQGTQDSPAVTAREAFLKRSKDAWKGGQA